MSQILGPDVSRYQPDPNWNQVRADARFRFAFVKASEGVDYAYASYYTENAPKVRAAGLVQGAYHFLLIGQDGGAQAEYFVKVAPNADMYAVDVEGAEGNDRFSSGQVAECVGAFAAAFKRLRPGKILFLYGRTLMRDKGIRSRMGCDHLWAPRYNGTVMTRANLGSCADYGWPDQLVKFWQFTNGRYGPEPHTVPGIGPVDVSVFLGSPEELEGIAGKKARGGARRGGGRAETTAGGGTPSTWTEEDWRSFQAHLPQPGKDDLRIRDYLLGQLDRRGNRPEPRGPGPRREGWHHEDDLIALREGFGKR